MAVPVGGTRTLGYDADGQLVCDELVASGEGRWITNSYDAAGCLRLSETAALGESLPSSSTLNVCGPQGTRVLRKTINHVTGAISRVIDLGLAELRPDENRLLMRLAVNGTTMVELSYALDTGRLDSRRSGYVHQDLRGAGPLLLRPPCVRPNAEALEQPGSLVLR